MNRQTTDYREDVVTWLDLLHLDDCVAFRSRQAAMPVRIHTTRRSFIAFGTMGLLALAGCHTPPTRREVVVTDRMFTFIGGVAGPWQIVRLEAVAGESLGRVPRLDVVSGTTNQLPTGAKWLVRGITSNQRYTTRQEMDRLKARQAALGRPKATHAALIPIKKTAAWWALAQDERRAIFEEQSKHIQTGLKYLPAVARRLHHCRDLLGEPFDFLTWFDYAPGDAAAFEELVATLRGSPEWRYVEREVDIRLVRDVAA